MKKVLFLHGDSLSNVYQELGKGLVGAFAELQLELVQLRMSSDPSFRQQLDAILKGDVQFAFGFAGAGHALREIAGDQNSPSLWDALQVPFIALYGDSPAYAADFHRQLGGYSISLYSFLEHLDLRMKLGDRHGTFGRSRPFVVSARVRSAIDMDKKKAGRIIFLKNGNSVKKLYRFWDGSFNIGTRKHLFALKEVLEADLALTEQKTVEQYVDEYLKAWSIESSSLIPLRLLLIAQMDDFFRRIKSELIANTMLDYPTEIRGVGWEHLSSAGRSGKLIPQCDFAASNKLMEEALAIVDMSPNTNSNYHDRYCRAAGLYTLCLTNQQTFMQHSVPLATAQTFSFDRASIAQRIESVLADASAAVEYGISVAEQFRAVFPVKAELSRWVELSDLVRTNQMTERPADAPSFLVWPPVFLASN